MTSKSVVHLQESGIEQVDRKFLRTYKPVHYCDQYHMSLVDTGIRCLFMAHTWNGLLQVADSHPKESARCPWERSVVATCPTAPDRNVRRSTSPAVNRVWRSMYKDRRKSKRGSHPTPLPVSMGDGGVNSHLGQKLQLTIWERIKIFNRVDF